MYVYSICIYSSMAEDFCSPFYYSDKVGLRTSSHYDSLPLHRMNACAMNHNHVKWPGHYEHWLPLCMPWGEASGGWGLGGGIYAGCLNLLSWWPFATHMPLSIEGEKPVSAKRLKASWSQEGLGLFACSNPSCIVFLCCPLKSYGYLTIKIKLTHS